MGGVAGGWDLPTTTTLDLLVPDVRPGNILHQVLPVSSQVERAATLPTQMCVSV